jgi:hypothetical protein
MSGKDKVDATTTTPRPPRPNVVPAMTSRAFVVEGRANETWDPMRDLDASKVLFHETIPIAIRGLQNQREEEDFPRGRFETTTTMSKKTTKNNNKNATTTMDAMEEEEMERVEIASVRILLGPTASTRSVERVLGWRRERIWDRRRRRRR